MSLMILFLPGLLPGICVLPFDISLYEFAKKDSLVMKARKEKRRRWDLNPQPAIVVNRATTAVPMSPDLILMVAINVKPTT